MNTPDLKTIENKAIVTNAALVLQNYTVNNQGHVTDRGKFEFCHWSVPYFHERVMDGDGQEVEEGFYILDTNALEKTIFNLSADKFEVWVDENGFVTGREGR